MGGVDPLGAVPVEDPVPVVVPGDELPAEVLDDEVGWVVGVELASVGDVGSPGVWLDVVDGVPVEAGGVVGVVDDSPGMVEVVPSEGAEGLTPPPLSAVEAPPVACSLILTGVAEVIEVEIGARGPGSVAALAPSPLVTAAEACVRAISREEGRLGPGSFDAALCTAVCADAAGGAGATIAARAWW